MYCTCLTMYLLPRRIGMMSISSVMILFFGDRANLQSSDSVVAMQISLWAYSVSLHHSTISESHRLFEKRASRIVCSIVYATRHLKISSSHLHLWPPALPSPLSPFLCFSLFVTPCSMAHVAYIAPPSLSSYRVVRLPIPVISSHSHSFFASSPL
jgi:hypothetical protein